MAMQENVVPTRVTDRWEIRDLYTRYCHAIDRIDAEAIYGIFHPDALIEKGAGDQWALVERADYVRGIIERQTRFQQASHQVTNIRVDFVGDDRAVSEAWCLAAERRRDASGAPVDYLFRLRYVDVLERREERVWRSARRRLVIDHVMVVPVDVDEVAGVLGGRFTGTRSIADDPGETFRTEQFSAFGA